MEDETKYFDRFPEINDYLETRAEVWQMSTESVVNGIWFQVLNHYFPFPQYLITVEYRIAIEGGDQQHIRPDFVVTKAGVWFEPESKNTYTNPIIFILEGKKAMSEQAMLKHFNGDQVTKYLNAIRGASARGHLMFASGRKCSFLCSDGHSIFPVAGNDVYQEAKGTVVLDIVSNQDKIHRTIKAIRKYLDQRLVLQA